MTSMTTRFETERFIVSPLSPADARKLVEVLLQDDVLAARVPWLTVKTLEGVLREAYGIEKQAAAGQLKVWGIASRDLRALIGAVIARNSLGGIDVEALVASRFWHDGVIEEAGEPVIEWLEEHAEEIRHIPMLVH